MAHLAQDLDFTRPASRLLRIAAAAGALSCGGSQAGDTSTPSDGGAAAASSGGHPSSSGGTGGTSADSGGGQGVASGGANGQGGSVSTGGQGGTPACLPGCILLCQGGLCDCHCPPAPSCEDFTRPALDKSCAADDDCFAGIHHLDCCGSVIVLGYNKTAAASFDTYEADCKQRVACFCPSQTPTLEDGQATSDVTLAFPRCINGQCFGSGPVFTGGP